MLPLNPDLPDGADGRELFVSYEEESPRAAAVINPPVRIDGRLTVCFSHLLSDGVVEGLSDVLRAVEAAAKRMGADAILGPMSPTLGQPRGLLISGSDHYPLFGMPGPSEAPVEVFAALGFEPYDELAQYSFDESADFDRTTKLADRLRRTKPQISIRSFDMTDLRRDVELVVGLYNSAYADNPGFVPLDAEGFWIENRGLVSIYAAEFGAIAFRDDEAIGFMMTMPDYNVLLRRTGHMPRAVRVLHLLLRWRAITEVRGMFIAVPPRERGRGVDVMLLAHVLTALQRRIKRLRLHVAWVSAKNEKWISQISRLSSDGVLESGRSRMYAKDLR